MKSIGKYFQHKIQTKKNKLENQKLHPIECYVCGSSTHIIMDCNKIYNIFVSYREEETLNETGMTLIMKEYGEVKKVILKRDR